MASGSRRPTPPPTRTPAPPTLSQAEEGSARSETGEQCRNAMAKANLKVGGRAAVFGSAVLLGWVCLLDGDTTSLLLAFATFLSGKALILLSMSMLGLPESLVSNGQRVASKFLLVVCITLSGMTLVSVYLALLPGRFNPYIGLSVVAVVLLLVAPVHCYVRRGAKGGG